MRPLEWYGKFDEKTGVLIERVKTTPDVVVTACLTLMGLGSCQTRMAGDLPSTAFMRVFGGCGGVHACPYCSSPSVLSACCHLRRSEPLQWAEADALEMLSVLSRQKHCVFADHGSLPDLDSDDGKAVLRIFRREHVDGPKLFGTTAGRAPEAKIFNRLVLSA